jgi:uncharacterized membrane protein (UPF0182 family)
MTVPQVYYNQEDLWEFPDEKYAGQTIMEPYYIPVKLPGSERLEYLLMLPLTPEGRDNMVAWMAAKCNPEDYGRMLVYPLPKEKLVYGPIQIEAMIDQNAAISQQLSLWDQKERLGSVRKRNAGTRPGSLKYKMSMFRNWDRSQVLSVMAVLLKNDKFFRR